MTETHMSNKHDSWLTIMYFIMEIYLHFEIKFIYKPLEKSRSRWPVVRHCWSCLPWVVCCLDLIGVGACLSPRVHLSVAWRSIVPRVVNLNCFHTLFAINTSFYRDFSIKELVFFSFRSVWENNEVMQWKAWELRLMHYSARVMHRLHVDIWIISFVPALCLASGRMVGDRMQCICHVIETDWRLLQVLINGL